MNNSLSKRFTTLGFIMTCIIVVFHCGNGVAEPISEIDRFVNDGVLKVCTNLAIIAMSYFFVTSGFLFFRDFTLDKYFKKIRKRTVTLLVPYVIWQFIFGIKMLVEGGKEAFVSTTFLLEAWPPNGPLWYMYAAFILMLFSPILYVLFRNKMVGAVCIIVIHTLSRIVFGIDYELVKSILEYGYISNIVYYLPAYFAGAYLGTISEEDKNGNEITSYVVIVGLIFAVMGFFNYDDINFFQSFMGELVSILLIYLVPANLDISKYKMVNFTFFMYVIHDSVDRNITPMIRSMFGRICSLASLVNIFGRILSLIIVITLATILWVVLSWISPKLLSLLSGGRVKKSITEVSNA